MTTRDFLAEAGGNARQVNIAGDNHGAIRVAVEKLGGGLQLHFGASSTVNVALTGTSHRPTVRDALAAGSVEAPYGRLPEFVVGRDDVIEALAKEGNADRPRIQVLSGMGGVGKTTVALTVAELAKQAGAEIY
jgi:Mrp family chromosome partitioning ATPase